MVPSPFETTDEILDQLEQWIEDGWEDLFQDGLEIPLCNETFCARCQDDPIQDDAGFYRRVDATCNLEDPKECAIRQFWQTHSFDLLLLSQLDFSALPPGKPREQMEKVQTQAEKVLSGGSPQGQRCSACLGDAVIAIESRTAPQPATLCATDHDFEPIGQALNIPVKVLTASAVEE
jgi:hypothetical protein